jgi:hypothetical protein
MKNLVFLSLNMVLVCVGIFAQNPLKERITSSVELAKLFPINGSDAFIKCGNSCKPKENVLKLFNNKEIQWKAHFEKSNPGDIDLNAYTNPGMNGSPSKDELFLMQNYGTFISDNQQLVLDFSTKAGEIRKTFDDRWVSEFENFTKEVRNCPSKVEGGSSDPACVNPIKVKYEKILNLIIDQYIKDLSIVLNSYSTRIKSDNSALEDILLKLDYGDKAAMPNIKQIVVSMQGQLLALVVSYGETVADMWANSCEKYSQIQTMKERMY